MANRYWVGGSGTWNSTNTANWSDTSGGPGGFSVPTATDDVFFDAASADSLSVIKLTGTMYCRNLDWTGFDGYQVQIDRGVIIDPSTLVTTYIYGNITLQAGMNVTINNPSGAGGYGWYWLFRGVGGTYTIDSANNDLSYVYSVDFAAFGLTTSVWNLVNDLNISAQFGEIRLVTGTFNTNNYAIRTYRFQVDDGGGGSSSTRVLNMGSSTLTVSDFRMVNSSYGAQINVGTSTIRLVLSGVCNFWGDGLHYNNVVVTSYVQVKGNNTFNSFSVDFQPVLGSVAIYMDFEAGSTNTFLSWTAAGLPNYKLILRSTVSGTQYTLNKSGGGTVLVPYLDVKDSIATPGATWFAGTKSVDSGNNVGWYFTSSGNFLDLLL